MPSIQPDLKSLKKLEIAKRQLDALHEEICILETSYFPHRDASELLEAIRKYIESFQSLLDRTNAGTASSEIQNGLAAIAAALVTFFLPILGSALRSTNVRNAFEIHAPLLGLARKCLGVEDVCLVLSSEWSFNPSIHRLNALSMNSKYAVIGIPVTESENTLLWGVAGHELGHLIWDRDNKEEKYRKLLEMCVLEKVTKTETFISEYNDCYPQISGSEAEIKKEIWDNTYDSITWAQKQVEEMFCDFVGLWLFGESYFYALVYYLNFYRTERSIESLNNKARIDKLIQACDSYGFVLPEDFYDPFEEPQPFFRSEKDAFHFKLADEVVRAQASILIGDVRGLMEGRGVQKPTTMGTSDCYNDFKKSVPARNPVCMADLISAGWRLVVEEFSFGDDLQISREHILNELILKSFEVLEYNTLTKPLMDRKSDVKSK